MVRLVLRQTERGRQREAERQERRTWESGTVYDSLAGGGEAAFEDKLRVQPVWELVARLGARLLQLLPQALALHER